MRSQNTHAKWQRIHRDNKQRIGVIQWAVILSIVTSLLAVIAYVLVGVVRRHFYGGETDERMMMWGIGIYQIMGMMTGVVVAVLSTVLYRRMTRLMDGLQAVADGDLQTYIPLDGAGEYRALYETFNNMVGELKDSRMQQQNFMNEFSHEFKTPIHSIHGFADYLLHNKVPHEEQQKYLRVIADESLRLSELSKNTMLLSRLDAQKLVMEKTRFCLAEQLRHCMILLLQKSEAKSLLMEAQLDEVWLYSNAEMIEQIWLNLLDNAIKYTPTGGSIHIWLIEENGQAKVMIRDNGIGMDAQTIDHVFDRYFQGDASHATKGFGLGLSIAKRVVDLCAGKITVRSHPGKGSTFTVILDSEIAK